MTTSTSGRAALMRRPSSLKDLVRDRWFSGLTSFHPRMISGAWLEAKTPTSSAMAGPRRHVRSCVPHLAQKLRLGHARHDEVEAQQVGIDARREERHVVPFDRGTHL